ncbi:MAG: type I glutamate--ammonia ligase [archaeon]
MISKKGIMEKAIEADVKLVQLMFSDLLGGIKCVTIPVDRLGEAMEKGIWFDGSSIEGFARISESDMYLAPDESTFGVIPWKNGEGAIARIICDVHRPNGEPLEINPRYILKKAMEKAYKMGYEYMVGPELEFFLFPKNEEGVVRPKMHDGAGYFDFAPKDAAEDVRKDIVFGLQSLGIIVEASHHEVAPSQHEIDFKYGSAVSTADNAITFKYVVKSIAPKHGLFASFMPKPVFGENGSGMHVHQSLFDVKTGKNIFYDETDKHKLSKTAKHFIAGQLAHVKAMSAILAPTVNSYKRLVPGYEAPVNICWGQNNRSALIRIPRISPGRENSCRAELRCPDPSCNPYLAFAVMLYAGLEGIEKKMEIPAPLEEESAYDLCEEDRKKLHIETLPGSLQLALEELKKDTLFKEVLGEKFFKKYIEIKEEEWEEYNIQVTEWEMEKYFPHI